MRDAQAVDTSVLDADPMPDASSDSTVAVDGRVDAGLTMCGLVPRAPHVRCADVDPYTVALYRLDEPDGSSAFVDGTGAFDGDVVGTLTSSGDTACPSGASWDLATNVYGVVSDDPAFHLPRGSVEVFVKPHLNIGSCQGIVGRDARLQDRPGHFSILMNAEHRVIVRLQGLFDDREVWVMSEPLVVDAWTHIGVNFGPPAAPGDPILELYVDGVRQSITDADLLGNCMPIVPAGMCNADCTTGIDGNENPWVIGAASHFSGEGSADNISNFFNGHVDHVRISCTHRAFDSD
jgi:hypothetical protein